MKQQAVILGWDSHLLSACRGIGLDAVVVVNRWTRQHVSMDEELAADVIQVDDYESITDVLRSLSAITGAGWRPVVVTTMDEYAVQAAALLGQLLGSRAQPVASSVLCRSKDLQKAALRDAGVPVADSMVVEDLGELDLPYGDAVLKPISGAGSERTFRVRDAVELERVRSALTAGSGRGRYLAERYVVGEEWHIDGVVRDGELVFCAAAKYREPCLDKIDANRPLASRIIDPVDELRDHERAADLAQRALPTLGMRDGIFHLEAFDPPDSDRLVFSELGSRRGGGMIQEAIEEKFGVDISLLHLLAILGDRPLPRTERDAHTVGRIDLPAQGGILLEHPSREEILKRPGVRQVRLSRPLGQVLRARQRNTHTRIGEVVMRSGEPDGFFDAADAVVSWFTDRVRMIPGPGATTVDLVDWRRSLPPGSVAAQTGVPRDLDPF